jgi:hypothetical protein
MKRLSDIVTVSLGAAALVMLVYAKDRPSPTPGVRTAMELIGYKTQASLTLSQRPAVGRQAGTPRPGARTTNQAGTTALRLPLGSGARRSVSGQTWTIRACPLHACFIPKTGRLGAQARMSVKRQEETFRLQSNRSILAAMSVMSLTDGICLSSMSVLR